jgi:hypothetical protein
LLITGNLNSIVFKRIYGCMVISCRYPYLPITIYKMVSINSNNYWEE